MFWIWEVLDLQDLARKLANENKKVLIFWLGVPPSDPRGRALQGTQLKPHPTYQLHTMY